MTMNSYPSPRTLGTVAGATLVTLLSTSAAASTDNPLLEILLSNGVINNTTAHTGWSFTASIGGRNIKTSGGDTYPQCEEGSAYLPGSPFDILLSSLSLLLNKDILELRLSREGE